MKALIYLCKALVKKLPGNRKVLPSIGSIVVLSLIFGSPVLAQQKPIFLSSYDSCHVHPPLPVSPRAAANVSSAVVRLAYVIPSNRTPQPHGVANFQKMIKKGQQWFREQMAQNGFEPKTFTVETEADGVTPLVHVVHVTETDDMLRGNGDGYDIWGKTMTATSNAGVSLWAIGEVWILIPEIHLMLPDGTVTGEVALGAGWGTGNRPGLAMIGSKALALFEPSVTTDDTPYDGKVLPAIGPYPMKQDRTFAWFEGTSLSSAASSWIGALFHETGHAFGLAHDFRNDDNFHGNLMGNGLRGMRGSLFPEKYPQDYTRLEYTSALILNVNHFFNKDKVETPSPNLAGIIPPYVVPRRGLAQVAFLGSDDDSLSLAHLRYNGDAVAEMPLNGKRAIDTAFAVPYFTPGDNNRYTIALHDKLGNVSYVDITLNIYGGYNQAPFPFIRINPAMPAPDQTVILDASRSNDVDNDQSSLLATWDVDNDGQWDTSPTTSKTLPFHYDAPGNYLVRLKLTDPAGGETISTPVSVRIPGVTTLTLLNAVTNQKIQELKDGDVIRLSETGRLLNIGANIAGKKVTKVAFDLEGPVSYFEIDKKYPFTLFDNGHGIKGRKFLPGEYTLTVRSFDRRKMIEALTMSFTVTDGFSITGFTLIDATSDIDIGSLSDGDIIDLPALRCDKLSVRAETQPRLLDKVEFVLYGRMEYGNTEFHYPYALFGDVTRQNSKTDYMGHRLPPGTYTLKATPYARGVKGTPYVITFTVIRGNTADGAAAKVTVYPTPASGSINVTHAANMEQAYMVLLNAAGKTLLRRPLSQQPEEQLNISEFGKGVHYLKIITTDRTQTIRLVFE